MRKRERARKRERENNSEVLLLLTNREGKKADTQLEETDRGETKQ